MPASDPRDFEVWCELGTVRFKQEKTTEAERADRRALDANPSYTLASPRTPTPRPQKTGTVHQ